MILSDVINHILDRGYLTVIDRAKYSMVSVSATHRLVSMESLLEGISHGPIEPKFRFKFWAWAMTRNLTFDFASLHQNDPLGFYHRHAEDTHQADCMSSGQLGEIMRDVGRTFPDHPFFAKTAPGEAVLARILKAIVSTRPDVGYCQGMNFIVGALLLTRLQEDGDKKQKDYVIEEFLKGSFEAEADVFWAVHAMMSKNGDGAVGDSGVLQMESIWKSGFPKMKLRVFQFDRLFKWNMPDLHAHCEEITLSSEVVVSQWFMTLFSYSIPLKFTFHFWDYIFVGSWPSIFKVTLALLYILKDKMMAMDLEGVGLMMRDWKRGKFDIPVPSPAQVLQRAEQYAVNDDTLMALQENYALEMMALTLKDKLTIDSSVHNSFHGGSMGIPKPGGQAWMRSFEEIPEEMSKEMEHVHKELIEMEKQIEKDKTIMQRKIITACDACENSQEVLDTAIREEVNWLEKTSEIKYQLNRCLKRAAALTLAAVEDEDSILKETAAKVVPPSEESELESQASSSNLHELVSSDSEEEAIHVQFDEDEAGGYEDEDDLKVSGDEQVSGKSSEGTRSSGYSSESASGSSQYTGSGSESCSGTESGSGSGSGSSGSGTESGSGTNSNSSPRSRSSSESIGQESVESQDSADMLYRLMMGKEAIVRSAGGESSSGKRKGARSTDSSLSGDASEEPSPIAVSPVSEIATERVPIVIAANTFPTEKLIPPGGHVPDKSLVLVDPTTAKTTGWMSSSVVEKMKHNPRRRVSNAGRGGGAWRGLNGVQTPSPTAAPAPAPANFAGSTPASAPHASPSRPSSVASSLLRARMSSGDIPTASLRRTEKINTEGASTPTSYTPTSVTSAEPVDSLLSSPTSAAERPVDSLSTPVKKDGELETKSESAVRNDASTDVSTVQENVENVEMGKSSDPDSAVEVSPREGSPSGYIRDGETDRPLSSEKDHLAKDGIPMPPPDAVAGSPPTKGFFRFSAGLREGMDMFYRATGGASASETEEDKPAKDQNGVKRKGSWLRPKSQSGSPTSGSATKSRLGFSRRHMDSMKKYSRDEARRKAQWVSDCRKLQKRVAKLNRALDHAKMCLEAATSAKNVAAMADGEAREWKESLCQQFQLLVQDSNRGRSQKLLYIAETYGM